MSNLEVFLVLDVEGLAGSRAQETANRLSPFPDRGPAVSNRCQTAGRELNPLQVPLRRKSHWDSRATVLAARSCGAKD